MLRCERTHLEVAPLAGAWIETDPPEDHILPDHVAPLAGAWIETATPRGSAPGLTSRAPRGRVD